MAKVAAAPVPGGGFGLAAAVGEALVIALGLFFIDD
jgi:hypothetical protein